MFLDEADIEVAAGKGGDGAVSLRHEKFVPRGGPDGGDGARGGDVVAIADPHLRTLVDVAYRRHYRAEDGGHGAANNRRGKRGASIEIPLPVGTIITDSSDGSLVADLSHAGERVLLARGGRAGRGNARFASSTRQTPRFAEKGEPGESRRLHLELKLLADVGIIGLPNVGKSSLIARVSSAKPKIADYPFTTLVPNLGVVRLEEGVSFVVADLPGLVEGAHHGAGRGHDFLRHVERTRLFLHLLDVTAPDREPLADFSTVNRELALYREELGERPQLVALNKVDLLPPPELLDRVESALGEQGHEVFRISALTGEGVTRLMWRAAQLLAEMVGPAGEEAPPLKVPRKPRRKLRVEQGGAGRFAVTGDDVERLVAMTDLDNEEAVRHLHRQLERLGVIRRLREMGAKDGDRVRIGQADLEFVE
ncbi:MAG: GTPase ObgE [Armatimonadota bacterium]